MNPTDPSNMQPQVPQQMPQPAPIPPAVSPRGEVNPFIITTIILTLLVIGLSGFGVWAYVGYSDQKNNVDEKVNAAVSDARRAQTLEDERKFAEREKEPYVPFVGPEDLGRVTFDYPKTWSTYVLRDARSGSTLYEAVLHPGVIPPLESGTFMALRVKILDRSYDRALEEYQGGVKSGDLKSTAISIEGESGTRLDGNFSKSMKGSAVFLPIRDKTLMLQTESEIFKNDFDKIILASLTFNK